MRILMLNYEFPPVGGGGGVAAYQLAKGFVKLGYKVDYVTTWFKGLKKFEQVEGINIHRIKVISRKELPTATIQSMVSFPFLAYNKCVSLCKKYKYTFMNTHFAIPTGPLGVWISKKFKIKNILSIHGGDIYDPSKNNSPHKKWFLKIVVKWVMNNSTSIIAQSSNTKQNAIKYYAPIKKIEIIPLAYEPFKFKKISRKELGLSENKRYIISIGRLIKRKGFDFFIKTLAKLPKNYEGVIIGDGPEKKNLINLNNKFKIANKIKFLAFINNEKKFQYLNNSDIYFLSSKHEGFGIVIQEAMQVGLPIIATDNGGQVDLIKEGVNGYLVKFGDINTTIKRIKSIKKENLFLRINKKEIQKFKIKKICEEYLKILK